eukprot:scaffold25817_cov65-Phaeocystis_antarctica.AAC.12
MAGPPPGGSDTRSTCSKASLSNDCWSHTSASTFARRGTRGGSVPNLHMSSGSPAPRLSFTRSVCLAASGAGSETLKHSVQAGRTQPERVELRRSGVACGMSAPCQRPTAAATRRYLSNSLQNLRAWEIDSKELRL